MTNPQHPAPPAGYAYEQGRLVPIVWPPNGEADPEEVGTIRGILDLLRRLLCGILDGGHADATRSRACAAARIIGLYETDAAAARAAKVARSTMKRAVAQMRQELLRNSSPTIRDM